MVQFLDQVIDVPVVVLVIFLRKGLLPGRVLQRFDEQIFDNDRVTMLKTVEIPQLPSRLGSSNSGLGCRRALRCSALTFWLMSLLCSCSWTWLRCPLLYNDRCLGYDSAENCVFCSCSSRTALTMSSWSLVVAKMLVKGQYWVVVIWGDYCLSWVMSAWRLALSVLRVSVCGLSC